MAHHASSKQRMAEFRRNPATPEGNIHRSDGNGQVQPPRPKREKRRKYLRDYARWLWPYRWQIAGVFTLALVVAAMDAVWPLAIKGMIDALSGDAARRGRVYRFNLLGIAIAAILLIKQAVDTLRDYRIAVLNAKVVFHLGGSLFEKGSSLSLSD